MTEENIDPREARMFWVLKKKQYELEKSESILKIGAAVRKFKMDALDKLRYKDFQKLQERDIELKRLIFECEAALMKLKLEGLNSNADVCPQEPSDHQR